MVMAGRRINRHSSVQLHLSKMGFVNSFMHKYDPWVPAHSCGCQFLETRWMAWSAVLMDWHIIDTTAMLQIVHWRRENRVRDVSIPCTRRLACHMCEVQHHNVHIVPSWLGNTPLVDSAHIFLSNLFLRCIMHTWSWTASQYSVNECVTCEADPIWVDSSVELFRG